MSTEYYDEAGHDDIQWLLKEHMPKDPTEHDFGEWLGLKPIELEPGVRVNRTVSASGEITDLLRLYYKNGQYFKAGNVIVFIYELFTITASDSDSGLKSYTVTMTLEVKRVLSITDWAATEEMKLDRAADVILRANERSWDRAFKAIGELKYRIEKLEKSE